jgi:quercetin dioxygenase-like cupin family protein
MHSKVSVPSVVQSISQPWTPKLVAAVNNHEIKVAKIRGAFIWHSHPNSDELFYILDGEVTLEIEDAPPVQLQKGDMFVVPRGVTHRPVAEAGAEILMVEMEGTINTGDVEGSGLTVVPEDVRGSTE